MCSGTGTAPRPRRPMIPLRRRRPPTRSSAAALEQVGPREGRLDLVLDDVRRRRLDDLSAGRPSPRSPGRGTGLPLRMGNPSGLPASPTVRARGGEGIREKPQLCNTVVHAVGTPHCAAPDRDSCCGLESQPESHGGSSAVASESAVLAGPIELPGKSSQTDIAPRVMPGATPRKPAVFWPNRCSSVTPTGRVAPGCILPPGRGRACRRRHPVGLASLPLASTGLWTLTLLWTQPGSPEQEWSG